MNGDDNRNSRSAGVPRPYASKTLPTPRNVLGSIVSPLKIWQAILLTALLSVVGLAVLVVHFGLPYSSSILGLGGAVATAAIGAGVRTHRRKDIKEVPSITDVSRTSEYVTAASRLTIYSIIGGFLTVGVLILSQFIYPDGAISDFTRLTVIVVSAVSFFCSYAVVTALCSYSSELSSSSFTTPVEISSLPEIIAILGFVVAPVAVYVAGSIYRQPAYVTLSFNVTVVDAVVVVMGMLLLYVATTSRL